MSMTTAENARAMRIMKELQQNVWFILQIVLLMLNSNSISCVLFSFYLLFFIRHLSPSIHCAAINNANHQLKMCRSQFLSLNLSFCARKYSKKKRGKTKNGVFVWMNRFITIHEREKPKYSHSVEIFRRYEHSFDERKTLTSIEMKEEEKKQDK